MKVVGQILETTDYNMFNIMKGNRDLRKISDLEKRMNNTKGYPFYLPIIVNDKFEIIDGQHRYFLCEKHNKPIRFIKQEDANIEDIITINIANNKWLLSDYIKSHADRGNGYYQMVYNLKIKSEVELGDISILSLMTTDGKIYGENYLKSGKLVLDPTKSMMNWYDNYPKYLDIVNILKSKNIGGYTQKYCVCSLVTMFNNENYNHEHFLKQLEKYSYMFNTKIYSKKYFLEIFENIHNYNSRKRPLRLF